MIVKTMKCLFKINYKLYKRRKLFILENVKVHNAFQLEMCVIVKETVQMVVMNSVLTQNHLMKHFYLVYCYFFTLNQIQSIFVSLACNPSKQIRCENHCISKKFFRDGIYNCPSHIDEHIDFLGEYSPISDNCHFDIDSIGNFIPIRIKDDKSCNNITCKYGYYKCHLQNYCISIELICNGISECFHQDDELDCRKTFTRVLHNFLIQK